MKTIHWLVGGLIVLLVIVLLVMPVLVSSPNAAPPIVAPVIAATAAPTVDLMPVPTAAPAALILVATSTPAALEMVAAPVVEPITAAPTTPAFTCTGGCAQPPDPSCAIKGNFNGSDGDKIYHPPGGRWYDGTDVNLEEGDVWFCTAAEAVAAGYRVAGG